MDFEKQKKAGGGRGATAMAKISLRKSNSIGINSRAVDEHLNDEPEWCEIYFDPEARVLGLKFSDEETEDSYKVSYSSGSATVAPTAVLNDLDLVPEVTEQFEIDEDTMDGDTLLTIDVDDSVATYGSPDEDE